MTDGTVLTVVKDAFANLLASRVENVSYGSPVNPEDVRGTDGSNVALWWDDDSDATVEVNVITGGPHWFDETWTATLVIQAVGLSTDDTQKVLDGRTSAVMYQAVGLLADDPHVGVTDTNELQLFTVLPAGVEHRTGIVGTGNRVSRFNLAVEVRGRTMFNI